MKQELNLTIPTEQLSILIQHQVDAVLKTISNLNQTNQKNTNVTNATNVALTTVGTTSIIPIESNNNIIESQELKSNDILVEVLNFTVDKNNSPSLKVLNDSSQTNQSQNHHPLLKDGHSSSQDSSESLSPRVDSSNYDINTITNRVSGVHDESHIKSEEIIESSDLLLLQKDTINGSKFDDLTIPRPDSDATTEELTDFTELLREIEKIDKECRAAKRVFEQRIQKHKITQV